MTTSDCDRDLFQASAFVVADVTNPGQRIQWLSRLDGRLVISADYAQGNLQGTWVRFAGIAKSPPVKHILLNTVFRTKHPTITAVLKHVFAQRGSQWKVYDTWPC